MTHSFKRALTFEDVGAYFDIIASEQTGTLNSMLKPQLFDVSQQEQTLIVRYRVEPWELNPQGNLHGGILASMFDFAMGILSCFAGSGPMTPTVSMSVNFLSVLRHGDDIFIKAVCEKRGKTLCSLTARAWGESDEKRTIATAIATYYCGQ